MNKFYWRIAQPLLYQDVDWSFDPDDNQRVSIPLLLRTITERPELSAEIKRVTIEGHMPSSIWLNPGEPEVSDACMDALKGLLHFYHLSPLELLEAQLDAGTPDVFSALFFLALSNIDYLNIGLDFHLSSPLTLSVIKQRLSRSVEVYTDRPSTPFDRLQQVLFCSAEIDYKDEFIELGFDNDEASIFDYPPDGEISPFLLCDSITHLTLWLQKNPSLPISNGLRETNLTTLVCHHSEPPEPKFERLLGCLRGLRRLEYHYFNSSTMSDGTRPSHLKCSELSKALEHVRDSIETLELNFKWNSFNDSSNHDNLITYCWEVKGRLNFFDFPRLTSLTVPLGMSIDSDPAFSTFKFSDVFPRSLQELCLTDDFLFYASSHWMQNDYLPRFDTFLQEWRSYTPDLRSLSFRMNDEESYRWGTEMLAEWLLEDHIPYRMHSLAEYHRAGRGRVSNNLAVRRVTDY